MSSMRVLGLCASLAVMMSGCFTNYTIREEEEQDAATMPDGSMPGPEAGTEPDDGPMRDDGVPPDMGPLPDGPMPMVIRCPVPPAANSQCFDFETGYDGLPAGTSVVATGGANGAVLEARTEMVAPGAFSVPFVSRPLPALSAARKRVGYSFFVQFETVSLEEPPGATDTNNALCFGSIATRMLTERRNYALCLKRGQLRFFEITTSSSTTTVRLPPGPMGAAVAAFMPDARATYRIEYSFTERVVGGPQLGVRVLQMGTATEVAQLMVPIPNLVGDVAEWTFGSLAIGPLAPTVVRYDLVNVNVGPAM